MANFITAKELYKLLVLDYKIKFQEGCFDFRLGDVSVAVRRKDVVGDVIQKWLEEWLKRSRIDFLANPVIQMPPDIYLNKENLKKDWLEIKAFNHEDSPRFSIATFKFFAQDLIERPWHIDADYLIFGYVINEAGILRIKDLWLKKVWQITKIMSQWPLTVKVTQGTVSEIRPCNWYTRRTKTKVFECKEDFLSAFEETLYKNPATNLFAKEWKRKFYKSYKKHYGKEIFIPSWENIKDKYTERAKI